MEKRMMTSKQISTMLIILTAILSTQLVKCEEYRTDFQSMFSKFESILDSKTSCDLKADVSRPCFDMTKSQSVLSQLCDRLASLEVRLDRLASRTTVNTANHCAEPDNLLKQQKEIIPQCKSSAFKAWKIKKIQTNVTNEPITEYNATLNEGTAIGFDALNGVYQAHYDGVYHFTLKYQAQPSTVDLEFFLVQGNTTLAQSRIDNSSQIDVLTHLKRSQQVWANLSTHNVPEDCEVNLTFSGFFLNSP